MLSAGSIAAGAAEAGVLALVAQIAAAMVADSDHVAVGLGPFAVDLRVGAALWSALGLAFARLVLQMLIAVLPARLAADTQAQWRRRLIDSFGEASWTAQAAARDGQLQELMGGQTIQATYAVLHVANAFWSGAMFVTLTVSAFVVSPVVAIVVLATALATFALLRPLNRAGRASAAELSQAEVDHAAEVGDVVRLAEESRVFGTGGAQRDRVHALIEISRNAFFHYTLTGRLAATTYQSVAIVLVVGGLGGLYAAGASDIASLGAVVLLLVRAGTYGQFLQGSYHGIQQALPYLERLNKVIAQYGSSAERNLGEPLPSITSIAFDHVGFAYTANRPVLQNLSFRIAAGEAIGIAGPSGAGKSTVVQLLLRLRTTGTGAVLVNGRPASSFSREDWQARVAYVPQDAKVLHGTIAENIRFFRKIDDAAVERAARLAHVHDDIVAMASGYDTVIGQRSDAVSGGQRQRICIARALAGSPDVLVLDEPTSALDVVSEAAVQGSLAQLHGQVTLIVVAHRLSTLSICDRVLVLDRGTVEAFAPLAEIAAANPFFQEATEFTAWPTMRGAKTLT